MSNPTLARFLAHSVELESEAGERYGELADIMEAHGNHPVADFFRRMEKEAAQHLDEVAVLAGETPLPRLTAWLLVVTAVFQPAWGVVASCSDARALVLATH